MSQPPQTTIKLHRPSFASALVTVFTPWRYRILALLATFAFALLSLYVPVWFIPANTLALVLALMHVPDMIILGVLSIASGLLVSINVFLIRRRVLGVATAEGGFGIAAALSAAVLLTSCGCGIGLIVGIFGIGIGGASFLTHYQFLISLVALAIVLIGLYMSARKVNAVCPV